MRTDPEGVVTGAGKLAQATKSSFRNPDKYSNLPEKMRQAKRWHVWKYVQKSGKDKPSKVPFYVNGTPRRGKLDSPEDLARLADFYEAKQELQLGRWDGLGFALGRDGDDYWQGVDFDNLDEHSGLQKFIDEAEGYVELSPSGKGAHLLGYGPDFKALSANGSGVEAYSHGRYFTVTGECLKGDGVPDLSPLVAELKPIHDGVIAGEGTADHKAGDVAAMFPVDTSMVMPRFTLPDKILNGSRNSTLITYAGSLRVRGVPQDVVEEVLHLVNKSLCETPLPLSEVTNVARRYQDHARGKIAARFNNRYAVVKINGEVLVIDKYSSQVLIDAMTFTAFKHWCAGMEGGSKAAADWFNSPERETLEKLIFDPQGGTKPGEFNVYQGLAILPVEGECRLIVKHIFEVWCSGDRQQLEYVIKWLAQLVQRPWEKPEVALVLRSVEGTGKSIITSMLLRIFGQHGFVASSKEQVCGRFNAHLFNKILLIFEEALFAGDPQAVASVKPLITNPELGYEGKNKPAFSAPNFAHVIVLTNNTWAVPAGADSRRWMVLDVSACKKGDHNYFSKLAGEISNGGTEAFLHVLMNINLAGWNPRAVVATQALQKQRFETLLRTDPVGAWWASVLADGAFSTEHGEIPWGVEVAASAVEDSYLHVTKRSRGAPGWALAAKQLRRFLPAGGLTRTRKNASGVRAVHYKLPTLSAARVSFKTATSIDATKI